MRTTLTTEERIACIKKQMDVSRFPISVWKAKLFTEAYKKNDGDPDILRTAKSQAYMLRNIPIYMLEEELIPGAPSALVMGLEADFWTRGVWRPEGVKSIKGDTLVTVDDETAEEMYGISDYWRNKVPEYKMLELFDDKMWRWKKSGYHLPKNRTVEEAAGSGVALSTLCIFPEMEFTSIPWAHVLATGLKKNIATAKEELAKIDAWDLKNAQNVKRSYALQAMIAINEGVIDWANRYADLAEEKAAACEDERRKEELLRIADTCRHVPAEPARDFRDAICMFWMLYILNHYLNTTPLGRLDQYLYPYYQKDIESGAIDKDTVMEYLELLRLKFMQINSTSGGEHRKKWSGQAAWRNLTLGGVKPDGTDATNDLTYMFIEAAKRCPTPHHTLTLRVHENTPKDLMDAAMDLVKTGCGMPAFISDKGYIDTLLTKGVPLEVARDYYMIGCLDITVPEGWGNLFSLCVTAMPFDTFMHNGYSTIQQLQVGPEWGDVTKIQSFDEFMDKMMEHYRYYFECFNTDRWLRFNVRKEFMQDALIISLYSDGCKVGLSPMDRKMPYGLGPAMGIGVGTINVGNSLAVIKKLVFDEKKLTMAELIKALDENWEGERNQEIRRMCLEVPKYGNDEDYVDNIVADLYGRLADMVSSITSYRNTKYVVAAISITSHDPGGKLVGATPDGRYAGQTLADGSASPEHGTDVNGPTAVLNSASKIPQIKCNSMLMNQKLSPSAVRTKEDTEKLEAMLESYLLEGGKHVQYNVVDNETLKKAKATPENYQDLMVRVAGYSAYFVRLDQRVQDEIISRTTFDKI